jgi:hypothetical protein
MPKEDVRAEMGPECRGEIHCLVAPELALHESKKYKGGVEPQQQPLCDGANGPKGPQRKLSALLFLGFVLGQNVICLTAWKVSSTPWGPIGSDQK